jgi:hypothetical protein
MGIVIGMVIGFGLALGAGKLRSRTKRDRVADVVWREHRERLQASLSDRMVRK